ncbi:phosphodiesterase, partial [Haematococcus lacustris]
MVLGIIHLTYEDFVLHLPNGQQQWRSILEKAGQQEDPGWVKQMCPFNDATIYSIVGATCEVLGQGAEEIGRSFGRHFVDAVTRLGYGKFLRSLSSSIIGFITTLNNLHMHLSAGAPAFVMPEFRTDKVPSPMHHNNQPGCSHVTVPYYCVKLGAVGQPVAQRSPAPAEAFHCVQVEADSLELHYRSKRAGLASWVEGIIQGLAIDYYDNMPLKMQLLRGRDDGSCDHE